MKKTLLTVFSIGAFAASTLAQTYTPSAGSPLASGDEGVAYAGQTINADIPTTVDIDGQAIIDVLPAQVAGIVGGFINAGTSYPVTVTSTVLTVEGLPAGLSDDCNGCTVTGGSDRDIVISGTPTEGGNFTVDVTSATTGSASIQGQEIPFGGSFTIPVVGTPVPVPALPGVLDASGYTMSIDPNSIAESNDVFSLKFYPNPTVGNATLDVNSLEGGVAVVEVYSITGSVVLSTMETIRVGTNRINVDLNGVPSGVYLIKADINGAQALIRTQKI